MLKYTDVMYVSVCTHISHAHAVSGLGSLGNIAFQASPPLRRERRHADCLPISNPTEGPGQCSPVLATNVGTFTIAFLRILTPQLLAREKLRCCSGT